MSKYASHLRILLLSSERSGSNLLRLMFDAHPEVAGPTAPHCAKTLAPFSHLYGDYQSEEVLEQVLADMVTLTRVHTDPWVHEFTPRKLMQYLERNTFWGAFDALYTALARAEGKVHWFSKENALFDYAFEFLLEMGEPVRFVYLMRDGRDYAVSLKNAASSYFNTYRMGVRWAEEQMRCMRIRQHLAQSGQLISVRYEDLITDAERELRRICEFLDLEFVPSMLDFHQTSAAKRIGGQSDYWKNLSKPLMRGNLNKYLSELSRREIKWFEAAAGAELAALGYELQFPDQEPVHSRYLDYLTLGLDVMRGLPARRRRFNEPNRRERTAVIQQIQTRLRRPASS